VSRVMRIATRTLAEYRQAISGFSSNARWLLASVVLTDFGIGMLITVFGVYVKTAGLSETVLGSVEGTISLAAAVACLCAPVVIGRGGYRRALVGAVIVLGAARLGQAAWPFAGALLAFSVMGGLGDGVIQAAVVPFLAENSTDAERPHLFSVDLFVRVFMAFLGGVAGGLLPAALATAMGALAAYRITVAVASVLLLLAAVPLSRLRDLRPPDRRTLRETAAAFSHFSSWPHVWRLMVPQVTISAGAGLIIPFLALYLKNGLGADIQTVGVVSGVSQLAMGIAVLGAPLLARRFGLVRSVVMVEAMSLPFMAVIPLIGDIRVAAVIFWIRAALMNMTWPLWNQYAMEGVPAHEKTAVASMLVFGWNAARFAGAIAGGALMTSSYTAPYYYATALYAIGTVATWLLNKDHDVRPGPMTPSLAQEGQL
jgi:MFS family permease